MSAELDFSRLHKLRSCDVDFCLFCCPACGDPIYLITSSSSLDLSFPVNLPNSRLISNFTCDVLPRRFSYKSITSFYYEIPPTSHHVLPIFHLKVFTITAILVKYTKFSKLIERLMLVRLVTMINISYTSQVAFNYSVIKLVIKRRG